jgi:hypothetical protein
MWRAAPPTEATCRRYAEQVLDAVKFIGVADSLPKLRFTWAPIRGRGADDDEWLARGFFNGPGPLLTHKRVPGGILILASDMPDLTRFVAFQPHAVQIPGPALQKLPPTRTWRPTDSAVPFSLLVRDRFGERPLTGADNS